MRPEHIRYTSTRFFWNCTIINPYVEKSIFYTSQPKNSTKDLQEITFDSWQNRYYNFVFIGRLDPWHKTYKFRYELGTKLYGYMKKFSTNHPGQYPYIYATNSYEHHKFVPCKKSCSYQCANCFDAQLSSNYLKHIYNSKFGLVIKGDTPSTSRFYDLVASGTIPIIISNFLYLEGLPFKNLVDYHKFCYFIDENLSYHKIINQIYQITAQSNQTEVAEKLKYLKFYAPEILWRRNSTRVSENILLEAAQPCVNL